MSTLTQSLTHVPRVATACTIALVTIAGFEGAAHSGWPVPMPSAWALLALLLASRFGGIAGGMSAAALLLAYSVHTSGFTTGHASEAVLWGQSSARILAFGLAALLLVALAQTGWRIRMSRPRWSRPPDGMKALSPGRDRCSSCEFVPAGRGQGIGGHVRCLEAFGRRSEQPTDRNSGTLRAPRCGGEGALESGRFSRRHRERRRAVPRHHAHVGRCLWRLPLRPQHEQPAGRRGLTPPPWFSCMCRGPASRSGATSLAERRGSTALQFTDSTDIGMRSRRCTCHRAGVRVVSARALMNLKH